MKNFKGTQGEWKAVKNVAFWEVNNNCNYQDGSISLSIGISLSRIGKELEDLNFTEEAEANAKLISCSPLLLQSLKDIIRTLPLGFSNEHTVQAEELIKKATEL